MPKGRPLLDLSNGKTCPRCEETKPLTAFYKSKDTVHGYQVYCKACQYKRHDKWRRANKPKMAQASKKWRDENPVLAQDHGLKTRYGLPLGAYDKMLITQDGKCAICQRETPGERTKRFHVDHCHQSGRIRGLLCHGCNVSIGHFNHDPKILQAAISYLAEGRREIRG